MKRLLDIFASALGLIILAPVLALIAIAVRLRMGSPVIFRQSRPGLHGRAFTIYKFRTMADGVAPDGSGVADDATRLTPLGGWLRSSSLDELPELLNILCGDMSFVGPRPLLMEYLPLYTSEQARRHEVRPGLTGLSQVRGRNALSWEQRFELDVWYVDHASLGLDAKILLDTVGAVLSRTGISHEGEATMTPFAGSADRTEASP